MFKYAFNYLDKSIIIRTTMNIISGTKLLKILIIITRLFVLNDNNQHIYLYFPYFVKVNLHN